MPTETNPTPQEILQMLRERTLDRTPENIACVPDVTPSDDEPRPTPEEYREMYDEALNHDLAKASRGYMHAYRQAKERDDMELCKELSGAFDGLISEQCEKIACLDAGLNGDTFIEAQRRVAIFLNVP